MSSWGEHRPSAICQNELAVWTWQMLTWKPVATHALYFLPLPSALLHSTAQMEAFSSL